MPKEAFEFEMEKLNPCELEEKMESLRKEYREEPTEEIYKKMLIVRKTTAKKIHEIIEGPEKQ